MRKLLFFLVMTFAAIANAEVITNESIIQMLSKGYSTEIITGFIENADECALTADMESIDALMAAGADSYLITFIQKRVKTDFGATDGLYWWNTGGKPQKVNIVAISKESKGFGGRLLGSAVRVAGTVAGVNAGSSGAITGSWIAGDVLSSANFKSDKLIIKGAQAHLRVADTNPVFRFVIPTSTEASFNPADLWYYSWLSGIQSPNEFQLIRLQLKGKGNKANRAFPTGLKWGVGGFSKDTQDANQEIVDFEIRQINNHTYEIFFPNGLEPGEYAFFYRDSENIFFREHLSAFDFSVPE